MTINSVDNDIKAAKAELARLEAKKATIDELQKLVSNTKEYIRVLNKLKGSTPNHCKALVDLFFGDFQGHNCHQNIEGVNFHKICSYLILEKEAQLEEFTKKLELELGSK